MKKVIFYLPRILAIIIVAFFALFILEGFSPGFTWQDSIAHLSVTLIVLAAATIAFKWPKIGGWLFTIFGLLFIFFNSRHELTGLIIGLVPLITGMLFLLNGFSKKGS